MSTRNEITAPSRALTAVPAMASGTGLARSRLKVAMANTSTLATRAPSMARNSDAVIEL